MIFIVGINSFIGRNLFLRFRKKNFRVHCLSHTDISDLSLTLCAEDVVINCCGVNRAQTAGDYIKGNHQFVQQLVNTLKQQVSVPYLIHFSSLMVQGFRNKTLDELPEYQRHFIRSKLAGDEYLTLTYPKDRYCILRPSNIFGFDCLPYQNNILVTLMHEKISGKNTCGKMNKNCLRNFLSVDGLCNQVEAMLTLRPIGILNMISSNTIDLGALVTLVYQKPAEENKTGELKPPEIVDGEESIPELDKPVKKPEASETVPSSAATTKKPLIVETMIVKEDLDASVRMMESKMRQLMRIRSAIQISSKTRLCQSRGDMVEISNLNANRLYCITLTKGAVRGNHYHLAQTEEFYVARGRPVFLLAYPDAPDVIHMVLLQPDQTIRIPPPLIHTLVNAEAEKCELFVVSTQPFVADSIPDTVYITLLPP